MDGSSSSRRDFLLSGLSATAALSALPASAEEKARLVPAGTIHPFKRSFSIDRNRVRLTSPSIREAFTLTMIADTHLFIDDDRGEPFRQFSSRMAGAYHETKHFQTGAPVNPEIGFTSALQAARENNSTFLALVGDIVSFPSEAAVEWTLAKLKESGLPWLYTAGNHDWHYEGMPGSSAELRDTWSRRRLAPLYFGAKPLMSVQEKNGVRLVCIDNSTYEIQPEQLTFFRQQVATGQPLVLFVHIPLYAPGRELGFGCGHPQWGAATDRSFELERRPRWREGGHTATTLDFHREVFAAQNLLGIFAGHTHQASVDVVNGVPQCVTAANAMCGYLQVDLVPA